MASVSLFRSRQGPQFIEYNGFVELQDSQDTLKFTAQQYDPYGPERHSCGSESKDDNSQYNGDII